MAKKKDDSGKKPPKSKTLPAKSAAQEKPEAGAARRVAKLRDKLTDAMQDPLTRDQIVRAIRALMQEK